jgi:hypothetical protein
MSDERPIHHHITDPLFRKAVELLDAGHVLELENHLDAHPHLLADAAAFSEASFPHGNEPDQYFYKPKLLWFVAENPIRNHALPDNIADITRCIIDKQRIHSPETLQHDLDYTLGLVVSGCVVRETGKRDDLIDLLIRNGANPNCADVALAHRELEAVQGLIDHGAEMTLAIAAGMGNLAELQRLFAPSDGETRRKALGCATINGQAAATQFLVENGVEPNQFPNSFLAHCTPLHNAVSSGDSETVSVLLGAGADTTIKDRMFDADALGWARHLERNQIAGLLEQARKGAM